MPIRLATRAVLVHESRLLLVNAFPGGTSDLWCAPGGGAEPGASLPDNLRREVHEETGLEIKVGPPCLINEFHDPDSGYHQVDLFFRCSLLSGRLSTDWQDPENVVTQRRFVTRDEMAKLRVKPDSLSHVAFGRGFGYDPLEVILPG
ncbi:NUDIX domain-containing protein [Roseovarius aestuariivivens]|uniref:NUDIX domain-containing protein n=1 Tax=Roseovarius aestuariivivens TaxID=1888910 RepID=UPI001080F729|nr:NUDIX domain-containing protein [Roseovarius aestuariivivens]